MAHTPAFAPVVAPLSSRRPAALSALGAPHEVVEQGRRRARQLAYGAGGAWRGLASRRARVAEMVRMSGDRWAANWVAAGANLGSSGMGGGTGGGGGGGNGGRGGDGEEEEWYVDPSWGAAPGVHVVMRGRADGAYKAAVANIVAMSVALTPKSGFVGDPAVPVVVILSWMGAQQKHLAKYKSFYEGMGYEVHCVFNDLKTAMFPPASRAQARRIGSFIADQPEGRPVLIHAFSIGTGIYGLLLDSLRQQEEQLEMIRKKVVGVVFDSGPAPIFPTDVAKGLHTVCPMVSRAIWEPIASAFFYVTKARASFGKGEDALRKFQFLAPQLYFFSQDDKVIPNIHHAVEEFIDKNKQRGVEVYKKIWEKSVHASHLRMHPEEYLTNLKSFVTRCMEVREEKMLPIAAK